MIKEVNIPFVLVMRTYPKLRKGCGDYGRLSRRV